MARKASQEAQDRPASRNGRSSAGSEENLHISLPEPSTSNEGAAGSEENETNAAKLGGETKNGEDAPEDDESADTPAEDASTIAGPSGPSGERNELTGTESTHGWQAIWSPPHNQYYFWNAHTGETTWVNPLESSAGSRRGNLASGSASTATTQGEVDPTNTVQSAAPETQELDPELAFLDPGLYASSRAGGVSSSYASRGTFDRRTGRFVPHGVAPTSEENVAHTGDAEDRHSQSAKAQRQMNAYFDVDEWQKQREEEQQQQRQSSKKTKSSRHPTKKELEIYKEKKKEKKASQLGWLRG